MTTIYTLGHSNHALGDFLALLRSNGIARLVDVRSQPYSRWAQFRKHALTRALGAAGIDYVFLGFELGGRPDGPEFYDREGHVDYSRRARAPDFLAGSERLVELGSSARTAILCAEEDPTRCHRRLLVMPELERRGIEVVHICGDGALEPEAKLRGPKPQLPLFG